MNAILEKLRRFDERLAAAERALMVACIAAMLILSAGQVALRFFAGGFAWADQLARFLVLWSALLGAALATRRRKHITIDVITKSLSERGRAVVGIASGAVGVLVCACLLIVCWDYVAVNFGDGTEATTIALPIWIVQAVLPYGFTSMALRFAMGLLEDVQGIRTGDFSYQHRFDDEADIHAAELAARQLERKEGTS